MGNGVLVIEDDPDVREALILAMESEGYPVMTAADGEEALEQLRRGLTPSVILLDLMMPRKNGWEFRAEQLQDPRLAGIPVIVVSAAPRARATDCPAEHYLQKPIDFDRLVGLVSRYC